MMIRRVLKFVFNDSPFLTPTVEGLGRVVLFGRQKDQLTVWIEALEGVDLPAARWHLHIFATGQPIVDEALMWIASAQDGPWVWHLYGKLVSQ